MTNVVVEIIAVAIIVFGSTATAMLYAISRAKSDLGEIKSGWRCEHEFEECPHKCGRWRLMPRDNDAD